MLYINLLNKPSKTTLQQNAIPWPKRQAGKGITKTLGLMSPTARSASYASDASIKRISQSNTKKCSAFARIIKNLLFTLE